MTMEREIPIIKEKRSVVDKMKNVVAKMYEKNIKFSDVLITTGVTLSVVGMFTPIPGDEILGFVTTGVGYSIAKLVDKPLERWATNQPQDGKELMEVVTTIGSAVQSRKKSDFSEGKTI